VTGNSLLAVHGLVKGKTTIQASSNCGTNTGPAFNVEVLNCDDDVMKELKRQESQLKARLSSNMYQQNELLSNDDFIESDTKGVKAIEDVASGLKDVAVMCSKPKGMGENMFKEALKLQSDYKSLKGNVNDQNNALIAWQVANMVAPDSKVKEVSSALKTFTELATATANLGAYLGTAFGVATQLAKLTEQYDKTQKEMDEVKRIMYEVCGRDEVNSQKEPDDDKGDKQAKEESEKQPKNDTKKNDPKSNQKNQTEAKDMPANQPEPTSSKTENDAPDKASSEPQDHTPKTDNSSSDPKTYSVGVDIDSEGKCDCAPNIDSTIMLSPENSKDTDEVLRLIRSINDVYQCYENFLQTTLQPIIESLKPLEAFYAKADSLSKLKRDELEKEIEGLKVLLLEIKPDKMQQQQIFQIEEFRYTSGGCAGQLK